MTSGYKKIQEVACVTMGTSPKGYTYNSVGEGLPLLNGPTEFGNKYPECTSFTTASVKECQPGDLIFCVRGSTTGRMNWADKTYSLGRGVCSIRGQSQVDTKFIRYCLDYKLQGLLQLAGGTTFPNLSQDTIKNFSIPFPDNHQEIAETLTTYDDLIENNRRRIALLEESARLLYQEWFVHLRFPGHERARVVNGLPQGWRQAKYPEFVDFLEGPGLRNYQYRDAGIPFLNIRTIQDDDIDFAKVQYLDESEVESRYSHFLLAEDDHVVSSSGTLGRVATVRASHLPVMLNTSIIRMRPKSFMTKWFLKAYLKHGDYLDQVTAMATGAAQLNYGPSHLGRLNITIPSEPLMKLFDEYASQFYMQIKVLQDCNQKLKVSRDILLPRLMSGEIAV